MREEAASSVGAERPRSGGRGGDAPSTGSVAPTLSTVLEDLDRISTQASLFQREEVELLKSFLILLSP